MATTDIHGCIFPTNYTSRDNIEPYGLARIASAIHQFRKLDNTVLLDNGDAIQGTPLLTYALQNRNKFENPMATAFNSLNYDFINLGNHDFNYGKDVLLEYIHQNKAPLLTQNVTYNGSPVGKTQIIDIHGKKIAFIGLLTQYIPKWERKEHIEGMVFESAKAHLEYEIKRLNNTVDYTVAVYHGGLERDLYTGEPTERLTGENEGYDLTLIKGLDILITGHQHRSFVEIVNGVLVTQSSFKGQEFVTIELDLESGAVLGKLHQSSNYDVDTDFLASFALLETETQEWLDKEIGFLEDGDVLIENEFDARIHKHKLVSLLNQIQSDRTQAQLSAVSLFNSPTGFKQHITMRDIVSTYLYPNTLVVKRVLGHDLKSMLEFSAEYFSIENGEIVVNPSYLWPKPQHYNYDMVDGIDYTIHVNNPIGDRIHDLMFNGKPLDLNAYYTLVVNNYRANGGGNFTMIEKSETLEEISEEMVDTLMNYFKKNPRVRIDHRENIRVIY